MAQEAGTSASGGTSGVNQTQALSEAESLDALAAVGGIPSNDFTMSTQISSLGDLKSKYPQLYKMILQSLAQNMMIDFQRREDRLDKALKQMRDDY